MQEVLSRAEAKLQGLKKYHPGHACAAGHVGDWHTSNGTCVECGRARLKAWRSENREAYQGGRQQHYRKNRERVRAQNKAWNAANPGRMRAAAARYRAAQLQATPAWLTEADKAEIQRIYDTCPPGYHVDHVVPLQGKLVCGLHVPGNLQHLLGPLNIAKSNRWDG